MKTIVLMINGIISEAYRELFSELILISALTICFIILALLSRGKGGGNNGFT
ncbi:MAG: hypothetical protein MRT15_10960 [archaeon YNP-LCB-003-016]|uniref:hypothetical protein n=1 Tax=Candidatus Culexarchaeum yellowstonense TaxID=2928963 RepID=UPI0026F1BF92|nr:hypothetical protein [Candidatus Culexarchaeum yellowstonense]MCR6692902.1 hypothetical protein [Candidatus Culexarchaeum yellowstonense]